MVVWPQWVIGMELFFYKNANVEEFFQILKHRWLSWCVDHNQNKVHSPESVFTDKVSSLKFIGGEKKFYHGVNVKPVQIRKYN